MATCLNSRFPVLLAALTLALTAPAFAQTNPGAEKDDTAVAEQVETVIKMAVSPDNLCQMYEGWSAWV